MRLSDQANYITSDDIIVYAISRGWYALDARRLQQLSVLHKLTRTRKRTRMGNIMRHKNALRLILKAEPDDVRAFSVRPPDKLGVEDVKQSCAPTTRAPATICPRAIS